MLSLACGELTIPILIPSPTGLLWLDVVGVFLLSPLQKLAVQFSPVR